MKVLILGPSGLIGSNALAQTLANPSITEVIAPTRKPLPPSSKLTNPVTEQLELLLSEALSWGVDSAICALGTTMGKAGSKEAFRQVDYVLPLAFAKLAHQRGVETFALVSAIGVSGNSSFFYPRTKGEVERDMKLVGFRSLTPWQSDVPYTTAMPENSGLMIILSRICSSIENGPAVAS